MVLLRPAAGRGVAPLPNDRAVPVQFPEHLVFVGQRQTGDRASLAAGHNSKPKNYVTPLAADEGGVNNPAWEAKLIPDVDLSADHVDKVGL